MTRLCPLSLVTLLFVPAIIIVETSSISSRTGIEPLIIDERIDYADLKAFATGIQLKGRIEGLCLGVVVPSGSISTKISLSTRRGIKSENMNQEMRLSTVTLTPEGGDRTRVRERLLPMGSEY